MNRVTQGTILVVEDETVTALDIQQSLRRRGYTVPDIACTGPEAIALAHQHRPDLVLMDIRLRGEMDGIEAARQIRKDLNLPVVFLTAYADCDTLQRAKSAEPFAYLLKPFEEVLLATTIEIALNKHQAHQLLVRESAEALAASEARFQRLADNVSDYAIHLLDPVGQILSWNPGGEQVYGWEAGEALGKHCSMLYPPDEQAQHKPEQDLETATRIRRHQEYGCQVRKDQLRFSAEMVLLALPNTPGHVAGFLRITRALSPVRTHN